MTVVQKRTKVKNWDFNGTIKYFIQLTSARETNFVVKQISNAGGLF